MDGGRNKNVKIGRILFLTDSIEGLMFYTSMLNHAVVVFSRNVRERLINKNKIKEFTG